jgi:superfamily II DNA or RNA helicase
MILRPYQLDSVARIIAAIDPMVVAPTGSGKTVIVAEVIRQAENKFVLVIAHRRELIKQMGDKLADFGITAGIILAGEPHGPRPGRVSSDPLVQMHARQHRPPASRHRGHRRGAPLPCSNLSPDR